MNHSACSTRGSRHAKEAYAATASIQGHCVAALADAASARFSTLARPSTTVDAQAGQCIAEFPTELQSWQR